MDPPGAWDPSRPPSMIVTLLVQQQILKFLAPSGARRPRAARVLFQVKVVFFSSRCSPAAAA